MKKTAIMTSAVLVSLGLTGCGSEYEKPIKSATDLVPIVGEMKDSGTEIMKEAKKGMKDMDMDKMKDHAAGMMEGGKKVMDKMKMEDMKMIDNKEMEKIDLAGYSDFSQEKFEALKGKQKFAVFFYADWCGTCKVWEKNIKENLATLPANTLILKADYDNDKDLVKALGVKSQSSLVLFNENGEIIDNLLDPSMEKVKEFFENSSADNITKSGEKYELYTDEIYKNLEGKQKFIIFFYADWCGTCRVWEKKFMESLDTLPENTKVLKADYDNDKALKEKFGIKMQSFAAFINADGSLSETIADPSMEKVKSFFQ